MQMLIVAIFSSDLDFNNNSIGVRLHSQEYSTYLVSKDTWFGIDKAIFPVR